MVCNCKEKIEELRNKIHKVELKVAKTEKEEGPFWARMTIANFIEQLRSEIFRVSCGCKKAQIINNIYILLNDVDVIKVISANLGGGTMKERMNLEIDFQNLCNLSRGFDSIKVYVDMGAFNSGIRKIATSRDSVTGRRVPSVKKY